VSLLWPNQLLVSFSTHGHALVYRHGLTKRTLFKQHRMDADVELDANQLLSQLDHDIASIKVERNTQLYFTLSADFARYLVLPAQPTLAFKSDRQSYAKAVYQEVFGSAVDSWIVQCADVPPNKAILSCAVDQNMLEGVKNLATKHLLNLRTLQPYLVASYNKIPNKFQSGYLIVIEPDRLLLLKLVDGCNQVKTMKWKGDWQQALAQMLQREALLDETSARDVMIYAPMAKGVSISPIKHWNIKRVGKLVKDVVSDGFTHPAYAMLEVLL
jgi:hypothetical protein